MCIHIHKSRRTICVQECVAVRIGCVAVCCCLWTAHFLFAISYTREEGVCVCMKAPQESPTESVHELSYTWSFVKEPYKKDYILQKRPIALLIHRKKELACAEENAFWEENAFSFAYMSSSTHERNYLVHRIYNYHIVCKASVSGLRFCVSEHVLLIHRSVNQIHRSVNTSVYQNMFFWYTEV